MVTALLLAAALAADDPPTEEAPSAKDAPAPEPSEPEPPAPPAPAGPAEYEVIVYGELQVARAREAVVQQLSEMGYDAEVIDMGDHVVYRHEAPWYGEVVLYDDGWMQVKRQPLRVEGKQMPWARLNSPGAWAGCLVWPWLCLRLSGATYSERKWLARESATVDVLAPKVQHYGDKIADLATSRKVDGLPERMTALWERGAPISGSGPELQTAAERRQALFDYWYSRTDTEWGEAVREAVESFCRAVVQTSDHPFTEAELDAYAAMLPERPFLRAPPHFAEEDR